MIINWLLFYTIINIDIVVAIILPGQRRDTEHQLG